MKNLTIYAHGNGGDCPEHGPHSGDDCPRCG